MVRVVVVALFAWNCGPVRSQPDPVRPRPVGVSTGVHGTDAIGVADIEAVEVLPSQEALRADTLAAVRRRHMRDTLTMQRRLWEQRRPRVYLIRVLELGACLDVRTRPRHDGQLLREVLVVQDTTVVRELVPIPAVHEQRCPLAWRVDHLFADVASALADTSARVSGIQYDPAYGFPRAYFVIRGSNHGLGVMVESFAATP